MRIANNVEMLEIKNENGTLYPVLLWDENDVILIDTGLPGQLDLITAAISQTGLSLEKITKVIITHGDMDHIGCAKQLRELGAALMAYENETPYIQGDKPSPKLVKMEERLNELSDNERRFYERIKTGAPHFYVHIDRVLKDDEVLPFCGGIRIISTPGHTPGHIALLLQHANLLVAGDAANIMDGELVGANPQHTVDMDMAEQSFEKLKSHEPDAIVCYHGGLYENIDTKTGSL